MTEASTQKPMPPAPSPAEDVHARLAGISALPLADQVGALEDLHRELETRLRASET